MKTQSDSEDQAIQQEVASWYHQQALEMPPEKLDHAVLQLAQTHVQAKYQGKAQSKALASASVKFVPLWRRHPWGFSSAASLVLVIGLVLLNRSHFDGSVIESSPLTMTVESSAVMQPRMAMSPKAPLSNDGDEASARMQAEAHIQAERQAKSVQAGDQQQARGAAALAKAATNTISEVSPTSAPLPSPELTPALIKQLSVDLAQWEQLIQQDKPRAIKFEQALLQDYAGIITGMNVAEKSEKAPVTQAQEHGENGDLLNDDAVNEQAVNDGTVSDKTASGDKVVQEWQQQLVSLQQRFTVLQQKLYAKPLADE